VPVMMPTIGSLREWLKTMTHRDRFIVSPWSWVAVAGRVTPGHAAWS
jgi:hypothetical protein